VLTNKTGTTRVATQAHVFWQTVVEAEEHTPKVRLSRALMLEVGAMRTRPSSSLRSARTAASVLAAFLWLIRSFGAGCFGLKARRKSTSQGCRRSRRARGGGGWGDVGRVLLGARRRANKPQADRRDCVLGPPRERGASGRPSTEQPATSTLVRYANSSLRSAELFRVVGGEASQRLD
jgi:hypothetical protein